jgi:hypothetical protein
MRVHWTTAALLTSVLVTTGCSSGQKAPDAADSSAAAPVATADTAPPPAPPAAPAADAPPPTAPAAPVSSSKPAKSPSPAKTAGTKTAASSSTSAASTAEPATPAAPPAPAAPAAPKVEYRTLRVPANTALALELITPLSSETSTVETPVKARLKQAIAVDGLTVLPAGTVLSGTVTDVASSGRVKGKSRLAFAFTDAVVAGAREKLKTPPVVFEGQSTTGKDATKIGVGAGVGAVIGGLLGGGGGAAKGAAIGGGVGTGAVLATKGAEVNLAEGAEIATTLADPFDLKVRVE